MHDHNGQHIQNTQKYAAIMQRRSRALDLVNVALEAINPRTATRRAVHQLNGQLNLEGCTVFAFGKAAFGMAEGVLDELTPKYGRVHCFQNGTLGPLTLIRSSHPHPADDAMERGREMLDLAYSLGAGDIALCLVSGGGSAMLEYPREGVSIEQISTSSNALMKAGANITTLNAKRRTLSAIKGGGLAEAIRPATVITIIISDTPGAPLETVASGPTLPADYTLVAADHMTACNAILKSAPELRHLPKLLCGEARLVGSNLAREKPGFVATGETTVQVTGRGRGGRNHELILGALNTWRKQGSASGLLLSIGTDGIDGSSDAAGAWCDETLLQTAPDPTKALLNNNSHHYFKGLNAQIITGPTGSNVADLVLSLP